jgi:hypothetical protein
VAVVFVQTMVNITISAIRGFIHPKISCSSSLVMSRS